MDTALSSQWRVLSQPLAVNPPPRGMDRLWLQTAGQLGRLWRSPSRFLRLADAILAQAPAHRHLSDRQLRDQASELQQRFRLGRDTPADRHRGLAILVEVAARAVGMRPYREQIAGALALDAGCIAEMATGEGKTLVATLPAVLAGWRGRGCHVITANDYLAERDADLMGAVYRFCGLTVACIAPDMAPADRRRAYHADVTYGTNKEVAADFLRDRLIVSGDNRLPALMLDRLIGDRRDRLGKLVQRGLAAAIVDEADSVFIDDAATPLLISGDGPNQDQIQAFEAAARLAAALEPAVDYRVLPERATVDLTAKGRTHLARLAAPLKGVWSGSRRREELVVQALVAKWVYRRDQHYVIAAGKVVIVDEFTGRLMPDRTWRNGLHQAVEAKEGVAINLPKETHARISFQRFFRLYHQLAGMSGTVAESRNEMLAIYGLPVIRIPTHRPCRRTVLPDRVFTTAEAKWRAVVSDVRRLRATGRPILIGTASVDESRHLSERLTTHGIGHRLLNAVRQASEARIIAGAGRQGSITVATNMAGRGTDIKLGPMVAERGGLHVIATQRFSARRIDRQLAGRCSRQGDPGSTQVFISLEDELIRKHGPLMAAIVRRFPGRGHREISNTFWRRWIQAVQRRAEGAAFRMRRHVLAADNWLDQQLGFAAREI